MSDIRNRHNLYIINYIYCRIVKIFEFKVITFISQQKLHYELLHTESENYFSEIFKKCIVM